MTTDWPALTMVGNGVNNAKDHTGHTELRKSNTQTQTPDFEKVKTRKLYSTRTFFRFFQILGKYLLLVSPRGLLSFFLLLFRGAEEGILSLLLCLFAVVLPVVLVTAVIVDIDTAAAAVVILLLVVVADLVGSIGRGVVVVLIVVFVVVSAAAVVAVVADYGSMGGG